MRKISFCTNEYYHIYNRGTDKRHIFLEKADYFRFLIGLQGFNGPKNKADRLICMYHPLIEAKPRPSTDVWVGIVCYCLMPNHFHLLLQQLQDDGISKYMHRLGTGYTAYFNLKYKRTGALFQGVFKAKHAATEEYVLHLSRYIHLNPSEICGETVYEYAWSSLRYYLDSHKPCVVGLTKDVIEKCFGSPKKYREFLARSDNLLDKDLGIDS